MSWLIELISNSFARPHYWTGVAPVPYVNDKGIATNELRWNGGITQMPKRAQSYSTKEAAEAAAAKLPKHPWGEWQALEAPQ